MISTERIMGFFLAHVLAPGDAEPHGYKVFIYLVRHKSNDGHKPEDLSDVARAEFFLGRMWGSRIFSEIPKEDGMIGMSTYAYAPFLCLCRVHMKDGGIVILNRYIDFEMGDMLVNTRSRIT